jgi:hypothetical protein
MSPVDVFHCQILPPHYSLKHLHLCTTKTFGEGEKGNNIRNKTNNKLKLFEFNLEHFNLEHIEISKKLTIIGTDLG